MVRCEICNEPITAPYWRSDKRTPATTVADEGAVLCTACVKVALLMAAADVNGKVRLHGEFVMMLLGIQADRERRALVVRRMRRSNHRKVLLKRTDRLGVSAEVLRRVTR